MLVSAYKLLSAIEVIVLIFKVSVAMKYTIFPFTDTSDNEKDAELFVFIVGNVKG